MRRGFKFEHEVQKVADYINANGGFATKLHAERTQEGIYLQGEAFDWIMFYMNYKCAFDTKEVKEEIWHMKKKDIVQTNNLKKCKNCGLDAYFLIYNDEKVKQIDVDYVIDVLISGSKSVKLDKYESWKMMEVIKC